MAIHIITDSTSEISQVDAAKSKLTVIPLSVNFGETEYLDGVSISVKDFYTKLRTAEVLPKTSQATPERFMEAYKSIITTDPHAEIIVITLSSALSGTYQSAAIAHTLVPEANVTLVDSQTVSFALKSLVEIAHKTLGSIKAQEWVIAQYLNDNRDTTLPQYVAHSDAMTSLQQFMLLCQKRIPGFASDTPIADIGITIGTHAGPGCVGITYFTK